MEEALFVPHVRRLLWRSARDRRSSVFPPPIRGKRAVVLVHGYRGSPSGTWQETPDYLERDPSAGDIDVFNFEYESEDRRAFAPAAELVRALDFIERSFGPSFLTLVAHSLGAVVARLALLDALASGRDWPKRLRMVLFAPAHKGADVLELQKLMLPGFLVGVWRKRSPVQFDLETGCQTLVDLERRTEELLARGGADCLVARCVVLADGDAIVSPNRFARDPAPVVLFGRDHRSICKAVASYPAPAKIILGLWP